MRKINMRDLEKVFEKLTEEKVEVVDMMFKVIHCTTITEFCDICGMQANKRFNTPLDWLIDNYRSTSLYSRSETKLLCRLVGLLEPLRYGYSKKICKICVKRYVRLRVRNNRLRTQKTMDYSDERLAFALKERLKVQLVIKKVDYNREMRRKNYVRLLQLQRWDRTNRFVEGRAYPERRGSGRKHRRDKPSLKEIVASMMSVTKKQKTMKLSTPKISIEQITAMITGKQGPTRRLRYVSPKHRYSPDDVGENPCDRCTEPLCDMENCDNRIFYERRKFRWLNTLH